MQRFILLVMAVCLFPSLALARTWTNREGKEIIADFVDATEEKVTLKKPDGKPVTFKLELLCDEDQDFIRGILARRVGKKPAASVSEPDSPFEAVTPAASSDLKSTVEPSSSDDKVEGLGTMRDVNETKRKPKPEKREWTDAFGNKTSGKFIRFQGNSVLVLRSGGQVMLDYWQLSEEDKDYLKELCEANGVAHLIPKVNPAEQRRNGPGAGNIAGGAGPAPGMSSPPRGAFSGPPVGSSLPTPGGSSPPSFPSTSLPSGISDPEDLAKKLREVQEQQAKTASTYTPPPSSVASGPTFPSGGTSYSPPPGASSSPPPGMFSPSPATSSPSSGMSMPPPGMSGPSSASFTPPSMGSSIPSSTMPSISDPTFGAPDMMIEEKVCGSCNKVVPSHITAGSNCPHCGVYFSFDDTNGKKAHGGFFGGGSGGGSRGTSRGMFRLIAVVVVLGIKGIAFVVWRSQQGSS